MVLSRSKVGPEQVCHGHQSKCGFWQFVDSDKRLLSIPPSGVLVAKICGWDQEELSARNRDNESTIHLTGSSTPRLPPPDPVNSKKYDRDVSVPKIPAQADQSSEACWFNRLLIFSSRCTCWVPSYTPGPVSLLVSFNFCVALRCIILLFIVIGFKGHLLHHFFLKHLNLSSCSK